METAAAPGSYLPMAIHLPPLPSPALGSGPSSTPPSHPRHRSQNLLVSPHPRNSLREPQTPFRNSHSCPPYELSQLPLAETHFNSKIRAPSTFNETLPCSQSASTPKGTSLSASYATSIQVSRPQSSHSDGSGPGSKKLYSEPRSSLHSIPRDILMGEPEPNMGLGSAVLLNSSTPLPNSAREVYRHVALRRYIRALLPMSRSMPVTGIPIDRWPETAEGILPFLDLTDERVQIALPYFGSAGYTHMYVMARILDKYRESGSATSEIRPDESIQQDYTTCSASTSNTFIKSSSCQAPGLQVQRQRQEIERFSNVRGRISGCGQTIVTRNPKAMDGGSSYTPEPTRSLCAGIGTPNQAVQRRPVKTPRLE